MSCAGYKTEIIEAARTGTAAAIQRHLELCASCRALFEEQMTLSEVIRALPQDRTPLVLEDALLKEFHSTWPSERKISRWLWVPVAAAAAVLLAFWLYPQPKSAPVAVISKAVEHPKAPPAPVLSPNRPAPEPRPAVAHRTPQRSQQDLPPFISIPYTTPLAPYERAEVMQVEMPVAELIAAGLPISTSDPGAQARADVIVGDDGRARAVRVLSIFERSIEQ